MYAVGLAAVLIVGPRLSIAKEHFWEGPTVVLVPNDKAKRPDRYESIPSWNPPRARHRLACADCGSAIDMGSICAAPLQQNLR